MAKGRRGENFPVGSFLIAAKYRPHIHAFYRFARLADDIADSPTLSQEEKLAKLDVLSEMLDGGRGSIAEAHALRLSLEETGVSTLYGQQLLAAFRMDALNQRFKDRDALVDYCFLSAVPVGRYLLDLHQESNEEARACADDFCVALQIINHTQDCKTDYVNLNRVYIPQNWLFLAGVTEEALGRNCAGLGLMAALFKMNELAGTRLNRALALPGLIENKGLRREAAAAIALAQALMKKLRGSDPLAKPVRLTRWQVGFAALSAWMRSPAKRR